MLLSEAFLLTIEMFNVQLFFAVAGALLISSTTDFQNADQAKPLYRPDCWSKGKDAKICAGIALDQAGRAEILLSHITVKLTNCSEAVQVLKDAEADFEAILKELTLEDLINALELLVAAYEKAESCCKSDVGRCPSVLFHIGNSIECTIAAILQQLTDDVKKQTIGDIKVQYFSQKERTEEEHAQDMNTFGLEVIEALMEGEETDLENN